MTLGEAHLPLVLKPEHWPPQDSKAWAAARTQSGYFDDGGAFAKWSAGTEKLHRQSYGQWLSFISRRRPDLAPLPPAERVSEDTVTMFIDETRARTTNRGVSQDVDKPVPRPVQARTIANHVTSLLIVMRGFAGERDWDWLARAANRLHRQSDPFRLKPPFPVSAAKLMGWSLAQLSYLAEDTNRSARDTAVAFRQALMVGVLIAAPVRVRALMSMTVGKHLDRSENTCILSFMPDDMKDRKSRRYPLPKELVPAINRYLLVHRPILLDGRQSDALWIGKRGNTLSIDSFTSGLALLTKRQFGISLRPHAFRHIAATSIAEYDPEHVGIIRDVLGHTTLEMSEKHYNRATTLLASRDHDEVLRSIRRAANKKSRRHRELNKRNERRED